MAYRDRCRRETLLGYLSVALVLHVTLGAAASAQTIDPLVEARAFYNQGEWARAIDAAAPALQLPGKQSEALLVMGRARLEQFRETADPSDLMRAREALRAVEPAQLSDRSRTELIVGFGEALYFDAAYRPASELFDTALGEAGDLAPADRDQVLDWWATALDRFAETREEGERSRIYQNIAERMGEELKRRPGSAAAVYWRVAAALARSEVDLAWHLAIAGWIQVSLAPANDAAVARTDLDRLVVRHIVPERLERLPNISDVDAARDGMLAEWELVKRKWTK